MRYKLVIAAILVLAGCTQRLAPEDRAALTQTQASAQEARDQAAQAARDAAMARASAEKSAQSAMYASERADRIFRYGGDK
ncbi:MAG: hypothetical protein HYU57_08950 [Micavibrio aeruginosavorus]|nr:hypothetical protein [Micavibrio aeruginosavorus]